VEICSISLDGAVLSQSLADTAAVLRESGGGEHLAQHTAVAMLLEPDDSDDDAPDTRVNVSKTPCHEKPEPPQ
jgi:hypothetical protein